MRMGLVVFSSALARSGNPKPKAPPATAETLMNFLLVVDIMESWSMIAVFSQRNRSVCGEDRNIRRCDPAPENSPAF